MVSAERLADKLQAGRQGGPAMLHQYPCGRIVSFIGLFGAAHGGPFILSRLCNVLECE